MIKRIRRGIESTFIFHEWGIHKKEHWLCWGSGDGFGAHWLPLPLQDLIVRLWNHLACKRWGHEDYGMRICVHCSHVFPGREEKMRELRAWVEEQMKDMKTIHSLDEIPEFANEDEEHAFWQTHQMSAEMWGEYTKDG